MKNFLLCSEVMLCFFILSSYSPAQFNSDNPAGKKPVITIVNSKTSEPLPGANLLSGSLQGISANYNGIAVLSENKNSYQFTISYLGFETKRAEINIVNGKAIPDTIYLKPKPVEVTSINVTAKRINWMPEISRPAELPSEDMMRKTGSLTGNSLKSYDYISTINTSNGKTNYLGLNERAISQKINGIPVKDFFFSFYRPYFGENVQHNLFIHPPPSEPQGILVLDSRTDFSRIHDFNFLASVDQARSQLSVSGLFNPGTGKKTIAKYDISLDGNLSQLYGIDILQPEQWQGTGAIQAIAGNNIFTLSGLYGSGSIILDYEHYKPFDNLIQKGLSFEWKKISAESAFELSLTHYQYNHKSGYTQYDFDESKNRIHIPEKDGSLKTYIKSNQISFRYTHNLKNLKTISGFESRYENWISSYMLPQLPNMFSLRSAVFADSLKNTNEIIAPGYAYIMTNWTINSNWKTEAGFIFAYDFMISEKIFPGPHLGISYTSNNQKLILDLLTSIRYMDHIYQSFNTDVSEYDYSTAEKPLAMHSTFKIKLNEIIFKNTSIEFEAAYLSLMDQHSAHLTEVPQDKFIDYSGGSLISEEKAEELYELVPLLSVDQETQQNMIKTIDILSRRDKLRPYFNRFNYEVNHNKKSVSFGIKFKWLDYLWASVNLSRTTYGSPFNPNSIPAEDDIGIICKINSLIYLFGEKKPKNLSTQISITYYGGERYTPFYVDKSLIEKLEIEKSMNILGNYIDKNVLSFLDGDGVRQGDRNSRQYPASVYSSLSLNYRFPIFNSEGGIGIFVSDWHQLLPGIGKNIYKKKYKMERVDNSGKIKFIEEDGVGQGIYGGINFLFNL